MRLRVKQQQQQENDGQQPQQHEGQRNHPRRQHQRNRGGGRGPVWCSYHKTTSHSDADCCTRRRKQADGNAHIAATGSLRIKGICSAFNLPEGDDQPECSLISYNSDGGTSHRGNTAEQSHNEETWSFSSLSASRPWPFLGTRQACYLFWSSGKVELSYMNGGTDGEGGSFYDITPVEPEPAEIKCKAARER